MFFKVKDENEKGREKEKIDSRLLVQMVFKGSNINKTYNIDKKNQIWGTEVLVTITKRSSKCKYFFVCNFVSNINEHLST